MNIFFLRSRRIFSPTFSIIESDRKIEEATITAKPKNCNKPIKIEFFTWSIS